MENNEIENKNQNNNKLNFKKGEIIIEILKEQQNIILNGAPGTGKSYLAKFIIANAIINDKSYKDLANKSDKDLREYYEKYKEQIEFVQFHPSYDYTDFVEGLRPDINNKSFKREDGIFKKFCKKAIENKDKKYVFIIDEINRAEISRVFGELFYSIDLGYRGKEKGRVNTQYQNMINDKEDPFYDGFYIPKNVYIVGTMNDIDRSVESIDFAFRRRFKWIEITAKDSIERIKDQKGNFFDDDFIDKIENLNIKIKEELGKEWEIGASYLSYKNKDNAIISYKNIYTNLEKLWKYSLKPLLKEYLRGRSKELQEKIYDIYENGKNGKWTECIFDENYIIEDFEPTKLDDDAKKILKKLGIEENEIKDYKIVFHKSDGETEPFYLDEEKLGNTFWIWNLWKNNHWGDRKKLIVFVKDPSKKDKNIYEYKGIQKLIGDKNFREILNNHIEKDNNGDIIKDSQGKPKYFSPSDKEKEEYFKPFEFDDKKKFKVEYNFSYPRVSQYFEKVLLNGIKIVEE